MARRDADAASRAGNAASTAARVVEVVYALPDEQCVRVLPLPPAGMTAAEAVVASGLVEKYPELAQRELPLGIFGTPCEPSRQLQPGDRVEIYRELRNDPRAMRRERAAQARRKGRRP